MQNLREGERAYSVSRLRKLKSWNSLHRRFWMPGWFTVRVTSRRDMKGQARSQKTKGATDCSVAPRLVPSPRYFAKFKLLQLWPCRTGAGRMYCHGGHSSRCCDVVNYAVFDGAEAAHATLVEDSWRAADRVTCVRRS